MLSPNDLNKPAEKQRTSSNKKDEYANPFHNFDSWMKKDDLPQTDHIDH